MPVRSGIIRFVNLEHIVKCRLSVGEQRLFEGPHVVVARARAICLALLLGGRGEEGTRVPASSGRVNHGHRVIDRTGRVGLYVGASLFKLFPSLI